jgi:hypothetical protein
VYKANFAKKKCVVRVNIIIHVTQRNLCISTSSWVSPIITLCKSGILDFIHRLYFNRSTTFRKLDLLPSSGKKGRTETLAVGPPGWASLRPGPGRVSVLPFLPEDGRRFSFRNVILLKYRRRAESKKLLLQIITHHRQNPSPFRLHLIIIMLFGGQQADSCWNASL